MNYSRLKGLDSSKFNMESYGNPSKKMRYDNCGIGGNDDLWGQDDLTAEEFDMLEIEATQSFVQREITATRPFVQKKPTTSSLGHMKVDSSNLKPLNRPSIAVEHNMCNGESQPDGEILKQQQYALEGKVKLLSFSLEKTEKELKDERLNRETIIQKKIETYQKTEEELKRQLGKNLSILQFKEQEMKTMHDKVRVLEVQLKEKKHNHTIEIKEEMPHQSSNKFLQRFTFNSKNQLETVDASVQTKEDFKFCRKYKLNLNAPLGESNCADLVSSVLCNRIASPYEGSLMSSITPLHQPVEFSLKLPVEPSPAMSLAQLNVNNSLGDLWLSYENILREHLEFLQSFSNFTKSNTSKKKTTNTLPSPVSARTLEIKSKKFTVLSCLKDLSTLLSCRQLDSLVDMSKTSPKGSTDTEMVPQLRHEAELDAYSCPLFFAEDEKMDTSCVTTHPLLKLLVTLVQPKTYPNGYENKDEEIEWCLASIAAWSSASENKLVHCIYDLPLCELISGRHGIMITYLTLKLLIQFSASDQFDAILVHKSDNCLLCEISYFCLHTIGSSPEKHINLMMMVENLFSLILTVHGNSRVKLESSPCISKMLQAFISVLWKLYQLDNCKNADIALTLKKGLILLLQFSKRIQDFKEKRFLVEDQYILLVCGFLTLSKENIEFKEFYDDIHELWDFQEDTSEFDLDETGDELSEPIVSD